MSYMVDSIISGHSTQCPRCGGMGSLPQHTCRGGFHADAKYDSEGKIVWTFKTKSGHVLSAARVRRDQIRRQLKMVREGLAHMKPLRELRAKLRRSVRDPDAEEAMSWMVESIVDPDPRACPRCGGMGMMFDHTCVGGIEADAKYVIGRDGYHNGKPVWTFKTKSGRVLSAARVRRDQIRRQLRDVQERLSHLKPLRELRAKLRAELKELKGK